MRKALIFANGEWIDGDAVQKALAEYADADVIAADGGVKFAIALNLPIKTLIGDLDSTPMDLVNQLEAAGTEMVRFEEDKDETDLELCLDWVYKQGYQDFMILAGLGGRIDQQITNLLILTAPDYIGSKIRISNGDEILQVHHPGIHHFVGNKTDRISLIPLTPEVKGVHTSGLRFPLMGESLYMFRGRGISNEICNSNAEVRFTKGVLISVQQITSD